MQLQLCTWPDVEAYLRACQGIVVPIGSTEQHGPTGLIGTDALCAEVVARAMGERTGAMVAPTLPVGMAEHHMAFPGTVTLRPGTLIHLVRDVVLSLAEHGFRRFLFLNGHGGNVPTLRAAFSEIHAEQRSRHGADAPDLRLKLVCWWENEGVAKLARELFGEREGSHATPSEISITQHAFPGHIRAAPLDPPTAPRGGFQGASDFRRRFPDGRIGSDPSLASPEHGARLAEAAAEALAGTWARFLAED